MKIPILIIAAIAAFPSMALADEPINETCPITGKPINPDITTTVGEDTVAFCCKRCIKGFLKKSPSTQLALIAELKTEIGDDDHKMGGHGDNADHDDHKMGGHGDDDDHDDHKMGGHKSGSMDAPSSKLVVHTPYLLDICPITGKKLGSMGDPVVEIIDGREVRFCCGGCPPKFKKNKTAQFVKIDKLMIADQLPYYPLKTCVISGDDLNIHETPTNLIYGNRLFRFCCNDCKEEFLENPAKYIPELDEAIIKNQSKDYPMTTCVIGKGSLTEMDGPEHMIVGNRLVELCCGGCKPKVLKNPLSVFAMIDAAKK